MSPRGGRRGSSRRVVLSILRISRIWVYQRFTFEPLLMEDYRKSTPISRGKSKARVESSHLIVGAGALWACRDVDLLSGLELR